MEIILGGSIYKMDGGNKQRLVDKKKSGREREVGRKATDGGCAAVTSVDLSI